MKNKIISLFSMNVLSDLRIYPKPRELKKTAPKIQFAILSFLLLFLLKLFLSGIAPIVGDEAYYIYWGRHFFGGYYDHPPMVGWWETIISSFSTASVFLRLPNAITMVVVAVFMYRLISKYFNSRTAYLISALWFFSPLPFLDVFVSPDIPLLFFSFFSSVFFFEAIEALKRSKEKNAFLHFLIAGLLFGGGFLSKYFIVFLLPAYLYYFYYRKIMKLWPIVVFSFGMLPFVLQHLYWNATHGWASLFFLFSRKNDFNKDVIMAFSSLIISLSLHFTPVWWADLLLNRSEIKRHDFPLKYYAGIMWILPTLCFTISALLGKGQGLHWYFFITPYFFIWIGLRFSEATLNLRMAQMVCLTLFAYLTLCVILFFPPSFLTKKLLNKAGLSAQLSLNKRVFFNQIDYYLNKVDLVVFGSYSDASTLELELMRYKGKNKPILSPLIVPEVNGRYGRVFDFIVDYNLFNGKNVLFILKKIKNAQEAEKSKNNLAGYFKSTHLLKKSIKYKGYLTSYYLLEGYSFNAKAYIKYKVQPEINRYYWNWCPSKFFHKDCTVQN